MLLGEHWGKKQHQYQHGWGANIKQTNQFQDSISLKLISGKLSLYMYQNHTLNFLAIKIHAQQFQDLIFKTI